MRRRSPSSGLIGQHQRMPDSRPPDYIPPERLDLDQIVEVLNRHQVNYVLIGGMAAVLHGSSIHTADVDTLIRHDRQNLEHLGAALRELGAQRATDVDAFITRIEEFETNAGTIDVMRKAKGIGTYEEVVPAKTELILLDNEEVRILDLPTLIAGKEATFDEHDRAHLRELYLLADEIGVPHRSLAEVEHDHDDSASHTHDEPGYSPGS